MAGNMSPPSTPLSKVTPTSGEPYTPGAKGTPLKSVEALKDLKNADTLGELMRDNGLMFDDKATFNKYPGFKDKVFDIIRQGRDSIMRPGSHKKFEAYLDCYARYNEATFLRKMFPLLMKDGLHLREEGLFTEAEKKQLGQGEYLAYRDFLIDEGIVETADREFLRTLVPSSCNRDCELYMAKVLAKASGMTNPKPDYTFGLQRDQFPRESEAMVPEYITALLNIAPGTRHAFLIVEGKPYDGVKAEAENQARRGGATLVHAERILRGLVEDVADIEGPDEKSFVFSVIIDPDIVEFWVHWYEGKGPGQLGKFHMNRLASRNLVEEEQREDIRRKMHNIMEWGGIHGHRYRDRKALHESIHTFAREKHEATLAIVHAKASRGSPRKRQRTESSSGQEEEVGSSRGRS